jgi:hypothetical protein
MGWTTGGRSSSPSRTKNIYNLQPRFSRAWMLLLSFNYLYYLFINIIILIYY